MAAAGSGSFQDGRIASKRLMMLVALLLASCCLGHGFGDEDHVEVEGISSSCMERESRALLAIKSDMYDPDNWFSTWTGKDCCGWRGVACDHTTGHVTRLDLHYPYTYDVRDISDIMETMGGSKVNSSLQELKHLTYLDLSMNNFSHAPVPKMIASLVHLEYLNLSYTMFDGPIPPQLGNLSNLHYLDLHGWNYDDSLHVDDLDWLSRITSLKYLDMSYVKLSKATNWFYIINSISTLEVLHLSSTRLPYVPSRLPPFNLTTIATLDLSWNSNITSAMLRWLSNATSLENLLLSSCGGLTIDISGQIPETIGDLQNLRILFLSKNHISGQIPKKIGKLHSLQYLDMSYNNLSGQIPTTLGDLCNLTVLDLSHNNIGGELTNLFYGLSTCSQGASISSLVLKGNNLSGIIPSSMGQLSQLHKVDLSSNSLAGNITEAHFLNLTSLLELIIAFNSLNVMLPNDWRPPFSAITIDMSFCHLRGKFPEWLQTQQQLQWLYLSGVGVSGSLPIWFSNFSKGLNNLYLSSNHLTGQLPSAPLFMLDLSNNSFVGPIPLDFREATNLKLLSLSHNHINDSLSPFFCNIYSLEVLDLSNNHLIGKVPECHNSFPTSLRSLHLNNNNLSGTIPSFLKYCNQLINLDLGENKLFDKIPKWIGRNLSSLKVLRLRSNLLYGVIPENIVNLTSLQVLDLSSNNLSGSLPSSLGNFTAMVEVQNKTWSSIEEYYFYTEGRLVITKVLTVEEYYYYIESILLTTKGEIADYTTILSLMTFIDLSNNHLSGEIPKELTKLLGLRFLNLSNNHLTGRIPENIGDIKILESLDLSVNSLTGEIPSSFSAMHFLARLNLSYNNLSGKIPTSGQLSTFDSWTYVGNKDLCGTPLPACPVYRTPRDASVKDDEQLERLLEYTSIVVGFVDHVEVEGIGSSCMESERRALLAIKSDMYDPDNWFSSWTGKDCCGWRGVACDNTTGHVTKLDLRYPDTYDVRDISDIMETMGGSKVNPSLQELKHLTYLDLSMNNFSHAPVPTMIASLVHLEYLNLSYAMFDGPIPPQLGNLSNLHYFDLQGWYDDLHVDDLDWLSRIPSLKYLDMSLVDLSRATNWFHIVNSISTLEVLHLSSTRLPYALSPLPPFNLTAIATLDLSWNSNITSAMLRWLSNATSLENLLLSSCGEIPSTIGGLQNLYFLCLRDNSIIGQIPDTIGRLHSLKYLDISNNNLSGLLPKTMGGLCNLTKIDLSQNNIGGELTNLFDGLSACTQWTSLLSLYMQHNHLSGTIPSSMGRVSQLQDLYLSSNSLVGNITEAHFSNLTNLLGFTISSNSLNVILPNDWHPPFNVEFIGMSFCHLGAELPAWLQTQTQLTTLYLCGVGLSGNLPIWFSNFSRGLQSLNMSSNNLRGRLPFVPQLMLDLSNNSFVGPIPPSFTKATKLSLLSLSHNHINDSLPPFFCNMQSLQVLDLSNSHLIGEVPDCQNSFPISLQSLHLNNNNMSGTIPLFLKHCHKLVTLDLGENKLHGRIPTWIGRNLWSLRVLRLRSNVLYGTIPVNIVNLTSLQLLDLSSNNLTGSLPSSLGNFRAMVEIQNDTKSVLHIETYYYEESILMTTKGSMFDYTTILSLVTSIDLSNNHISGEIPKELTQLLGLRFLNLSKNHLTGRIPEKIGDMKQLESLDLSVNDLTGEIPSSFSAMHFLERLNLSYNNLSGKIPTSGQLSTFDSSTYVGNKGLCGMPLPDCPVYQTPPDARVKHEDDEKLDKLLEYTSIVVGFVVGFWLFIGTLIMKQAIRFAFFRRIDKTSDWIYVQFAVKLAKLKSKWQTMT
ncbi:unnamed protein product [Musa acuminata var. zebrina]